MRRSLSRLKATHLIPPLAALVLVGSWNVAQTRSISALGHDTAELRVRVSAAATSTSDSADHSTADTSPSRIDWKQMPAKIAAFHHDGEKAQLRAIIDLQQRLQKMSRGELIAALDEIDALGLSESEREEIVTMILESLIKLDPQYALARFVDQIESSSSSIGYHLAGAFGKWAKTNPAAATAWFDQQIAAGKFESRTLDGRSEMRASFESELLETLLSDDLAAAARRIQALPEDQRREVLEQLEFSQLEPREQTAYASLVRDLIPADEREGSFAHIASQLIHEGDYAQVSSFLDSVQAAPTERAAAAKQAAVSRMEMLAQDGGISRTEVDNLRAWVKQQAPDQADTITGKALAEASQDGGKFDYDAASELVIHYQQTSGNDDVLIAFLEGYSARSNFDEARDLAELISDPKQREEILNRLK